mgnify:CR=1 FL=1
MSKLIGYLGTCPTPYCGGISGYFCVKCRHYVTECRCGDYTGGCECQGDDYRRWWASKGERRIMEQELADWEAAHA